GTLWNGAEEFLDYRVVADSSPDAPPVDVQAIAQSVKQRVATSIPVRVRVEVAKDYGDRRTIRIRLTGHNVKGLQEAQQRISRRMTMDGKLHMRVLAHRQIDQETISLAEVQAGMDVVRKIAGEPDEIVARWVPLAQRGKYTPEVILRDKHVCT